MKITKKRGKVLLTGIMTLLLLFGAGLNMSVYADQNGNNGRWGSSDDPMEQRRIDQKRKEAREEREREVQRQQAAEDRAKRERQQQANEEEAARQAQLDREKRQRQEEAARQQAAAEQAQKEQEKRNNGIHFEDNKGNSYTIW